MRARRAGATVADQAFSSASNFVVGLFVARLSGPEAFGAFAIATVCWLLVAGIHRALIAEPLAIAGEPDREQVRAGLAAELALGAAAAGVIALAGVVVAGFGARVIGLGLLSLAPWLLVLLVQDYWRWVAFARRRPGAALLNDIVYTAVQLGVLLGVAAAGHRGLSVSLAAWGIGAAVGAGLGAIQFRIRPGLRGGVRAVRDSWPTSRWLLADFAGSYGSMQLTLFVLTGLLGPVGIGLLRAADNLMGPANVLLLGGTSYGLPESSRALARDGRAGLDRVVGGVSLFTGLGIAVYAATVAVLAPTLMRVVYGPDYAPYGVLVQLAAVAVTLRGFGWGPSIGLKADRRTRSLFALRVFGTVVSLALGVPLALAGGVRGAAEAAAFASAAYLIAVWTVYRRPARAASERRPEPVLAATGGGA